MAITLSRLTPGRFSLGWPKVSAIIPLIGLGPSPAPTRSANLPSSHFAGLLPMAGNPDVTVMAMTPMAANPECALIGRDSPITMDPDPASTPFPGARYPNIGHIRLGRNDFDLGGRRLGGRGLNHGVGRRAGRRRRGRGNTTGQHRQTNCNDSNFCNNGLSHISFSSFHQTNIVQICFNNLARKIVRGIRAKPHKKGAREAQPQSKMTAAKMLKRYKRKRGREKQMLKAESRKRKFLTADDADYHR